MVQPGQCKEESQAHPSMDEAVDYPPEFLECMERGSTGIVGWWNGLEQPARVLRTILNSPKSGQALILSYHVGVGRANCRKSHLIEPKGEFLKEGH